MPSPHAVPWDVSVLPGPVLHKHTTCYNWNLDWLVLTGASVMASHWLRSHLILRADSRIFLACKTATAGHPTADENPRETAENKERRMTETEGQSEGNGWHQTPLRPFPHQLNDITEPPVAVIGQLACPGKQVEIHYCVCECVLYVCVSFVCKRVERPLSGDVTTDRVDIKIICW